MVAPNDPPVDKRVAANRSNAAKSTGPRTEAGKARSSMNALKHGLTAQTALLPGEDAEELREFAESLEAQVGPVGAMQRVLVQRVVAIAWKLRRVPAAEARAVAAMEEDRLAHWARVKRMDEQLPSPFGGPGPRPLPRDGGALLADSFREAGRNGATPVDGRLIRITAYELKLEGSLRATMRELRALQKDQNFAPRDPEPSSPAPASVTETAPGATTPSAPAADPEKPPQLAAVEPTCEAAPDAGIPSIPEEKRPSQNELPTHAQPAPSRQNESAGP